MEALSRVRKYGFGGVMMECKHKEGDWIDDCQWWLCCECWLKMDERPKRYEMVSTGDASSGPVAPMVQRLSWQAKVATYDGTSLNKFLQAMALRFNKKAGIGKYESYCLAVDVLSNIPDLKYGDKDYDWTISGAIDMADEEMTYWDEERGLGN